MYIGPVLSELQQGLIAGLSDGRPLPPAVGRAMRALLGMDCSRDGLARLFQPSFPGVRAFVVQPRVAPDQSVELTLVGVARDGRPVWTGTRAFVLGRDGSVEIHRGFDEIEPAFQHRNTTVDLIQRELELLEITGRGENSRLTIDAEGVGRYLCALHGFVFADETDEGPPVRSNRPFDADSDREQLIEAAERFLEETGTKLGLGRIAIEGAREEARRAETALDFARIGFAGVPRRFVDGTDGMTGATLLGRDFLLGRDTPSWRAALYMRPPTPSTRLAGDDYRRAKTADYRDRLDQEVSAALRDLEAEHRPTRLKALEVLGRCAGRDAIARVRHLTESADRRVAGLARRTLRQLEGGDLLERMKEFVDDDKADPRLRGLVLRVLSEHHPTEVRQRSLLLRAHPDARIQRAVVPLVAAAAQGSAELAAMLAANPRHERRPGLAQLRLELIERLAERADPMTLPVIIAEHSMASDGGDPTELLALSRALVAFQDPRARAALARATRSYHRPVLP